MKIAGIFPLSGIEEPQKTISLNEPLGLECVLAVAQKRGHQVKVFRPKSCKEIDKIAEFNPQMALFSLVTSQYNLGKDLLNELKKIKPALVSIAGGYHPSAKPDIVKEGFDFVVIGEGEKTFNALLEAIEENRGDYSSINGVSFLKDNNIIITKPRERILNFENVPHPYRELDVLANQKERIYLNYPPTSKSRIAYAEFSRGCLFNCSFCCSPSVLGRTMAFRDPNEMISQLKDLKNRFEINYVFFTDLNITLNKRRLTALCDALIREDLGIYWSCMSGFSGIDKDLLNKMRDSGCTKIGWGLETISPANLEGKSSKLPSQDKIKEILDYSAAIGILNESFLIIGFPNEKKKDLEELSEVLPQYNFHLIRPAIYTPLPGSLDYEIMKDEGKIIEDNWDNFDCMHLVFQHEFLNEQILQEAQQKIIKKFYTSQNYKKRVSLFIEKYPSRRQSFDEFFSQNPKLVL